MNEPKASRNLAEPAMTSGCLRALTGNELRTFMTARTTKHSPTARSIRYINPAFRKIELCGKPTFRYPFRQFSIENAESRLPQTPSRVTSPEFSRAIPMLTRGPQIEDQKKGSRVATPPPFWVLLPEQPNRCN